jgi:FMN-dependent NADH-azoreductase
MKLLEIQSSPRGESSDSIALTKSFIEACKSDNPSIVVDTLNVWHERLPEFDYETIGAKYKEVKHETMTDAEANVWERIQSLIQRLQNADRIVSGAPMWNFGLPYKLKQLIDLVAQRNYVYLRRQTVRSSLGRGQGYRRLYMRLTFPGRYLYTALALRSPSNLSGLLVAACRCSRSSNRDC